ncbi:hypothetical protein ATCC90586_011146 [Pythium insidiosum]|nr:hypothetical protein ATCC90586_011146 [Pythium insidiosum]
MSATQRASFKIQFADLSSEEVLCRCAWQPHGELLAFPVNQSIVELVDRKTWSSRGQLLLPIGKSQSSDINLLSFSPNGQYLLAATLKKELFIWSVNTKEVVRSFRVEHNVLSIAWSPNDNVFTAYNDGGRVGFVKDAIPQGLTPPQHVGGALSAAAKAATAKKSKSNSAVKDVGQFIDDEAEVDGDADAADEDDEAELRVEAIKARYGFGSSATTTTASADLGLADDTIDDDDDHHHLHGGTRGDVGVVNGGSPFRTLQEPFQPGSVTDGHGVSLLAWTPLGEIECLRGASRSENLVKVEFADKSRRGFKFSDNYRFSLAALDDHGACFAVPRRVREDWDDDSADQEHGDIVSSYVFYRPFDTWASNSSWHIDLPDGEDAECVATAREFCAVATSLLCLRVFTTSGIPFALLRLPGRVVTMAAQGSRLAVVYNDVYGRLEFQLVEIRVTPDAERVRVLAQGRLPMTPPPVDLFASHKENDEQRADPRQWTTLKWLGFDERGVLYAVDSIGVVQALARSYDWQWFPIGCVGNGLSKKPEERASIFTLGVVNNALLYFPLEPGTTAPKLRGKHRPVPLQFALQHASFPTTKSAVPAGKKKKQDTGPVVNDLWQQVRLAAIDGETIEDDDKRVHEQAEMDKSLILMMKAACTNDEPARVFDLAKCLHLEKSHQIAQKLAIHFGLRQLQTMLYDLYRERFEQPRERRNDEAHDATQTVVFKHTQPIEPTTQLQGPVRGNPRLARQPKAQLEQEPAQPEDEHIGDEPPSTPPSSSDVSFGKAKSRPAEEPARPVVERSVAPSNPFLKKPSPSAADSAGAAKGAASKKGGLERLAKFTSPPPAKKARPWK